MDLHFSKINKEIKVCLIFSLILIVTVYILWMIPIPIPIQDYQLMTSEELLISRKDLALNYPLGSFLLHVGFAGLCLTSLYFIGLTMLNLIDKYKK